MDIIKKIMHFEPYYCTLSPKKVIATSLNQNFCNTAVLGKVIRVKPNYEQLVRRYNHLYVTRGVSHLSLTHILAANQYHF